MPASIVFATNNEHKLHEMRDILGSSYSVLSLSDIGCHDDIPETAPTLEGNALQKARWVADRYGCDCFADDTGLEVEALDGAPGVLSARFARACGRGDSHDSQANSALLLERLAGIDNRRARFRTAIALIAGGKATVVEGIVEGSIAIEPRGTDGFGYDPLFIPEGHRCTFAQMSAAEKNAISHRHNAAMALRRVLEGAGSAN